MLNSQALETAIGLALMMFVFATAASGILDLGRRLINSRSKDLEVALRSLLSDSRPQWWRRFGRALTRLIGFVGGPRLAGAEETAWQHFTSTSVYRGAAAARSQVRPVYLSATSFAEAVEELARQHTTITGPLGERVEALRKATAGSALEIRAGLERWFDDAMAGLSSRFEKKSRIWLFVIGFALAAGLNASFPHVARDLWQDSVTRETVVAAAQQTGASAPATAESLDDVADATQQLQSLELPIGWGSADRPTGASWPEHILGWLLTAALASLGGPFWFDLMTRFTAARSARPAKAADDDTSASRILTLPPASQPSVPDWPDPPAAAADDPAYGQNSRVPVHA